MPQRIPLTPWCSRISSTTSMLHRRLQKFRAESLDQIQIHDPGEVAPRIRMRSQLGESAGHVEVPTDTTTTSLDLIRSQMLDRDLVLNALLRDELSGQTKLRLGVVVAPVSLPLRSTTGMLEVKAVVVCSRSAPGHVVIPHGLNDRVRIDVVVRARAR